jgi:hypothetical protein
VMRKNNEWDNSAFAFLKRTRKSVEEGRGTHPKGRKWTRYHIGQSRIAYLWPRNRKDKII